jgi:hypothetical protein
MNAERKPFVSGLNNDSIPQSGKLSCGRRGGPGSHGETGLDPLSVKVNPRPGKRGAALTTTESAPSTPIERAS